MNYLSLCSGIEAATVAWKDLGFNPIGFSEIEPFPCDLLAHHYPDVPNFGDMTKYKEWQINETVDLVVGGTPCQSFSVAGLRKGLDDPRGNLMLTYLGIIDRFKPTWFIWENVPGVLSSNRGRDFGSFLGAVAKLGYGFSYRVLDAQFFGVPQRRKRVFVVGHIRDWRCAAGVLFERKSVPRNFKASGKQGENTTKRPEGSFNGSIGYVGSSFGQFKESPISGSLTTGNCSTIRGDTPLIVDWPAKVACTLDASFGCLYGQDNQHIDGGASLFVPVLAFQSNHSSSMDMPVFENKTPTLTTNARYMAVCFSPDRRDGIRVYGDKTPTLTAFMGTGGNNVPCVSLEDTYAIAENTIGRSVTSGGNGVGVSKGAMYTLTTSNPHAVMYKRRVRRLMPIECERLQGFPDDYTLISGQKKSKIEDDMYAYLLKKYPGLTLDQAKRLSKDSPRYKALGNSMAVPVMRWIGQRIQQINQAQ